jgi:prepilin-type N-terminal cleavage/methylation domain-containing protein
VKKSQKYYQGGFTLIEVLIAGVLICIALIAALQFLGYCILLEQLARNSWHESIQKWNLSRDLRSGNKKIEVEYKPFSDQPVLYSVEIEGNLSTSDWQVILNETTK